MGLGVNVLVLDLGSARKSPPTGAAHLCGALYARLLRPFAADEAPPAFAARVPLSKALLAGAWPREGAVAANPCLLLATALASQGAPLRESFSTRVIAALGVRRWRRRRRRRRRGAAGGAPPTTRDDYGGHPTLCHDPRAKCGVPCRSCAW